MKFATFAIGIMMSSLSFGADFNPNKVANIIDNLVGPMSLIQYRNNNMDERDLCYQLGIMHNQNVEVERYYIQTSSRIPDEQREFGSALRRLEVGCRSGGFEAAYTDPTKTVPEIKQKLIESFQLIQTNLLQAVRENPSRERIGENGSESCINVSSDQSKNLPSSSSEPRNSSSALVN